MEETIIAILGPTASGKTHLAVQLAHEINGEIISADSRQVYKGMNIGTGKDLAEYKVGPNEIPYHLIDIVNAGEKYNLARFQTDFETAVKKVISNSRVPILCGGSGLYLQSVIQGFNNTVIPENKTLRTYLETLSDARLKELLTEKGENYDTRKRAIRKLEILDFGKPNTSAEMTNNTNHRFRVFGLNPAVDVRRQKISTRLKSRIQQEGMIDEVQNLLFEGLSYEMLEYYGLEYKYIAQFLQGFMRYDEMYTKLETEIHRFAKRQMTFFRSMEKKGIEIDWLEDSLTLKDKIDYIKRRSLLR